ncbi:uncharacterized protein LOC116003864 [Ipomoea triloba]|uniref:uncharacterized protein LOC116003864 n=1 Tax=Ipomoea triloba TaxID=35885 RepID=UPI00125DEECA|nr:uncharacterized protein LOC116003864 [Ipomoea triloba]
MGLERRPAASRSVREGIGESGGPAPRHSTRRRTPQEDLVVKLQRKIDDLEKKVEAREHSPEPEVRMTAPFSPDIMEVPLPKTFRLPTIKAYTGTSDWHAHMTRYKAAMVMTRASDTIMCGAFLSTLDGEAHDWFNTIQDSSIQTFAELSKNFLTYFFGNIQHKKPFSHLCGAAILIFIQALRSGDFHKQLNAHHPCSSEDLMRTANRYAEVEEADRKKKDEEEGRKGGQPDKVGPSNQAPRPNQLPATNGKVQERPRLAPPRHLTPLTHPVSVIPILSHVEEMGMMHFPSECMAVSTCED